MTTRIRFVYISKQKAMATYPYLPKQAIIDDLAELDFLIEEFYSVAATEPYETSGPLIIIERSYLSLFNNNKLHYELQLLVQPTQYEGGEHID